MIDVLGQVQATNFWSDTPGSGTLYVKILVGFLLGMALLFGLMQAPTQMRRGIVSAFVFVAGLYYVLLYVFPASVDAKPGDIPNGPIEGVGFWLKDSLAAVVPITNVVAAFLGGLGIYSLLRIHGVRLVRQQKDWGFSLVLLTSMVVMFIFGLLDFLSRQGADGQKLDNPQSWGLIQYGRDFLFEGLLQQMDAAMFSIIAFYILSAAYRAFRVRSLEATILLGTALLVILSLMGLVQHSVDAGIANRFGQDSFANNFGLKSIADFISTTFQSPAIRGVQFGIGLGTLAMGLRIWLSLERTHN